MQKVLGLGSLWLLECWEGEGKQAPSLEPHHDN